MSSGSMRRKEVFLDEYMKSMEVLLLTMNSKDRPESLALDNPPPQLHLLF